ncbi:MAG: hypothetical protein AAGF23_05305 [Acidobacteriota bacterium]
MQRWRSFFTRPALDTWHGLDRVLEGPASLGWVFFGLAIGWWIYVPFHELLHAFACMATGGEVTKLEVAPLYGGHVLAAIFPWVEAGGEYAGRLSGFDTHGNDLIYLATDFGPFLLTLFPGVWALRRAVDTGKPWLYGGALPVALAPFLSFTGDAYEIGSILTTRLAPFRDHLDQLRGDDALLWIENHVGVAGAPWGGFVLSLSIGLLWAFATYALAAALANRLGAPPVSPRPAAAPAPDSIPEGDSDE